MNSVSLVSLCSLAGRYDNPIPPRFLAPIDCLKIPALVLMESTSPSPPCNSLIGHLLKSMKWRCCSLVWPISFMTQTSSQGHRTFTEKSFRIQNANKCLRSCVEFVINFVRSKLKFRISGLKQLNTFECKFRKYKVILLSENLASEILALENNSVKKRKSPWASENAELVCRLCYITTSRVNKQ